MARQPRALEPIALHPTSRDSAEAQQAAYLTLARADDLAAEAHRLRAEAHRLLAGASPRPPTPTTSAPDELVTLPVAAQRLGVCVATLRRWRRQGVLPAGAEVRYERQVYLRWARLVEAL